MSKVASAAATLGVGEDQLAAQLSTIISVTRQAPETVGTALRTVYARITDIQAGLDEDGVTLGKYSGDMAKIGISVLDLNGNLRNMGEVMEEIGSKWSTMTQEQKIYLAQTMAGQRQYSNLMALFDNFDKYESALKTAQNAEGKLQEQQDVYMDRLSTHVQQLTTATEHMWMGLTDTDGFKDVIDGLTTIVEKVDKLFQSIGGGKNLLQSLVPIVMSLTSKTVANGINTMIINSQLEKRQLRDQKSSQVLAQNEMEALQKKGQQGSQRYQVLKQKSEFLQAAPGTFSTQQMDEINKRWSGSLEAAEVVDKARSDLAGVSGAVEIVSGINPLDTKVSIDTLEGAIETASKSYKKLSNSVNNFIQQQNATNQNQDEAQKNLINAYNQAVKEEQRIIQEENVRQQVLSKATKTFGVVSMPGQPIEGETLDQLSTKVNAAQRQQQTSIKKIQRSINFSTVNQGQDFLTEDAYKGISNVLNGRKIEQAQFGALEQLSQFQSLKNFSGKDKEKALQQLLSGSIFEDVFNDQEKKSGQVTQDKFIVAIKSRVISLKQSLEKAEQELGKIQNIKNNFIPSNNYAQLSQLAAQDIQNAQNALKNQSQTNLTIQRSGEFTQILDILNKQLPQAASESKEKLLDFSQRFNDINKKVLDFNTSIGKTDLSNTDEIQKLIEEREKLIQERTDFLQEFEDFSNDVGGNIVSKGEEAAQAQKKADVITNNNNKANKDTKNDVDRQKAIQAAIQLSSSLIQLQTSFSSIKEALSSDDGNQIFQNLLINIPLLISGIVTTINSIKVLKANFGLLGKEMTGTLIPGIKGVNTTLGATMITVAAGIAALMAIKAVAEAHQKSLQGQIKVNENIIKTEKEKQEIYKNQLGIIAEVEELNNKYKQGAISKGQLIEKTQELQEKYKDESNEIKKLISNYNHLQQAAKKAKENQLNELKESKDKQLKAAEKNINLRLQGRQYSQNDLFDSFNIFAMAARSRGSAVFNAGWGQGKAEASLAAALQRANLGGQFGSYIELYNAKTSQEAASQIAILQEWADTTSETNTDLFRNVQVFLEEQKPFLEDWKESQLQKLSIVSQSEALNYSQDFNNVNTGQEYQAVYREVYEKIYNKAKEEGDLEGLDSDKIKETITNQVNSIIPTKLKESYKSYVDVIDKIQSSNPNIKLTDPQKKEIFNLNEDQLNAFSTNSFELASNAQDIENAVRNIRNMDFSNMQPFTAASIESVAESYEKIYQIIKAIQEGKTIKNTAIKQLLEDKNFDFTEEQIKSLMQQRFSGNWETKDDITQQQVIDFFRSKAIEKSQNDIKESQSNIDILKNKPKVNNIKVKNESSLSFNNPIQEPLFTEQDFFIKDSNLQLTQSDNSKSYKRRLKNSDQVNAFFKEYDRSDFNATNPGTGNYYSSGLMKALIEQAKSAGLSEDDLAAFASAIKDGKSIDNYDGDTIKNEKISEFRRRVSSLLQRVPYVEASETEDKVNREADSKNKKNANSMLNVLDKTGYKNQIKLNSWRQQVNNSDNVLSEDTFNEIKTAYQETAGELEKIPEKLKEENETLKEKYRLLYQQEFPTDLDIDKSLQKQLAEQYQLMAEKSELLDKALKNNAKNAKDVAAAILRYQAAIDKTADSYSSWIDILNNGSTAEKIKIMPDLKDAFGDMLDIDGLGLSNTFATTSSNLELMKVALEDTGQAGKQAYEKLQQLAQLDILNNMGLNSEQIIEIQEQLNILKDFANESVKTGAEISYDDVKNYLETILTINKDITSEQLTHLLTLMNIDADLVVVDGHIQKINTFAKSATYGLKQQQTSTDKLKDLERERIKNQKELTKFLKDERDIYHQINRLLSDQERTIKRITRNQQDMYGTELLDNLNAESAEYKKQQKLLKSKQKLQQQDLANKKAELASKGASFDANGNISNYNNLIGSAINNVNSIISRERGVQEAMNQHLLSGGNTGDEIYKDLDAQLFFIGKEKSQANDYLNDLKTDLSNYEKVKDQAEDVADQLTELSEKQIEINLKKFNMKLELTLDLSQATKTWNDYKRNVLQHDDIFNPNRALSAQKDNAQRLADINSDSQSLDVVNKQIAEAMADNGTLYKTQGQKKKAIEELQKKAIQLRKGILETEDAIKQTYLDQYNIIGETFEKQKSQYEFINNQLEHNKNLMKLVYGEEDYAIQNLYNDKMIQNNLQLIESMNNRIKIAESNLQEAKKSGDIAVIEAAKAEWQTAIQNRNQLEEQSIQLIKDRYITAINQISHQMEMKLTNNKGFSYLDTEWDLLKKKSNLYLDDINSAFAIKDVQYNYIQALNDVKGLKNQQQLKKVMDQQLSILKEKDKLTQYDVDRAEKVLEIEKARIALEQARNNKTQMRLKRDSQGNYSYQYVADQDEIAKAEQELNKAENDLYNFDKENYQNNLEEAYNATKEYHEKIAALNEEWNKASVERRVKIEKELKLLEKKYSNYIINLTGETEWTKQNLMDSAAQSAIRNMGQQQIAFENMSNAQKQKWLGDMVPAINSGIAEMIGRFSEDSDSFKNIVAEATQAMNEKRQEYQNGLSELEKVAGQSYKNIKKGIDEVEASEKTLIEDNNKLFNQAQKIVDEMSKTITALDKQEKAWKSVYSQTDAAVERVYDYIEAINKAGLAKLDENNGGGGGIGGGIATVPISGIFNTTKGIPPSSSKSPSSIGNPVKSSNWLSNWKSAPGWDMKSIVNKAIEITKNSKINSGALFSKLTLGNQNGQLYLVGFDLQGKTIQKGEDISAFVNGVEDLGPGKFANYFRGVMRDMYGFINGWNKFAPNKIKFDTGGYTGNWNSSEGKLAILHEKELVLNKEDTINMLKMLEIVRNTQQMQLKTRMTQFNNEIQNILKQTNQVGKIQSQTDSIEQSVKIAATFPNVNSKKEIEEALINLTNKAAQFALKHKK